MTPGSAKQKLCRQRRRYKSYLYLLEHPCVDCGESDPIVLQYDHVRGVKDFAIGAEISSTRQSWDKILQEIAKCDVRCANCHARHHAKENGSHDYTDVKLVPPRSIPHGTRGGYTYHRCRCEDCTTANRQAQRDRTMRNRAKADLTNE